MNAITKADVKYLSRKSSGVEIKPVYAWSGWERYVAGYMAIGYGFSSPRFPRRGMAEAWIKEFLRGSFKGY